MNRKFFNLLGLARRAGSLVLGANAVEKNLKRNKARLVFFAEDAAENTVDNILRHIGKRRHFFIGTKQSWGEFFDRKELGVFAVLNPNFAQGLLDALGDEFAATQAKLQPSDAPPTHVSKKNIRKRALAARQKLSDEARQAASKKISKRLIYSKIFQAAQTIHTYAALPEEVDTRQIITTALRQGKKVIVPKIKAISGKLAHYALSHLDDLEPGAFGVLEPNVEKCKKLESIAPDVIIVPGVAFDKKGNRVGFGKGYYDRFLAETSGVKIGLAFSVQIVRKAAADAHDVRMDVILTEDDEMVFRL